MYLGTAFLRRQAPGKRGAYRRRNGNRVVLEEFVRQPHGVALLAAGLAFAVWARVHLGRNWSGSVTVKAGHELIRTGPYGYVRHPIYTGLIAALLGTAITSGTVRAAVGFAIMVVAFLYKLRLEEAFMRETFPEEYPRYAAVVPRLIPWPRPRQSAPR